MMAAKATQKAEKKLQKKAAAAQKAKFDTQLKQLKDEQSKKLATLLANEKNEAAANGNAEGDQLKKYKEKWEKQTKDAMAKQVAKTKATSDAALADLKTGYEAKMAKLKSSLAGSVMNGQISGGKVHGKMLTQQQVLKQERALAVRAAKMAAKQTKIQEEKLTKIALQKASDADAKKYQKQLSELKAREEKKIKRLEAKHNQDSSSMKAKLVKAVGDQAKSKSEETARMHWKEQTIKQLALVKSGFEKKVLALQDGFAAKVEKASHSAVVKEKVKALKQERAIARKAATMAASRTKNEEEKLMKMALAKASQDQRERYETQMTTLRENQQVQLATMKSQELAEEKADSEAANATLALYQKRWKSSMQRAMKMATDTSNTKAAKAIQILRSELATKIVKLRYELKENANVSAALGAAKAAEAKEEQQVVVTKTELAKARNETHRVQDWKNAQLEQQKVLVTQLRASMHDQNHSSSAERKANQANLTAALALVALLRVEVTAAANTSLALKQARAAEKEEEQRIAQFKLRLAASANTSAALAVAQEDVANEESRVQLMKKRLASAANQTAFLRVQKQAEMASEQLKMEKLKAELREAKEGGGKQLQQKMLDVAAAKAQVKLLRVQLKTAAASTASLTASKKAEEDAAEARLSLLQSSMQAERAKEAARRAAKDPIRKLKGQQLRAEAKAKAQALAEAQAQLKTVMAKETEASAALAVTKAAEEAAESRLKRQRAAATEREAATALKWQRKKAELEATQKWERSQAQAKATESAHELAQSQALAQAQAVALAKSQAREVAEAEAAGESPPLAIKQATAETAAAAAAAAAAPAAPAAQISGEVSKRQHRDRDYWKERRDRDSSPYQSRAIDQLMHPREAAAAKAAAAAAAAANESTQQYAEPRVPLPSTAATSNAREQPLTTDQLATAADFFLTTRTHPMFTPATLPCLLAVCCEQVQGRSGDAGAVLRPAAGMAGGRGPPGSRPLGARRRRRRLAAAQPLPAPAPALPRRNGYAAPAGDCRVRRSPPRRLRPVPTRRGHASARVPAAAAARAWARAPDGCEPEPPVWWRGERHA
jgi:hypothetical protein